MDLFSVTRFTENKENNTWEKINTSQHTEYIDEKRTEKNNLTQLLSKINIRKRNKIDLVNREQNAKEKLSINDENTNQEVNETKAELQSLSDRPYENYESEDEEIPKKCRIIDPHKIEGFTILGVDQFDKKQQVERVLPKWLRTPVIISTNLDNLNENLIQKSLNNNLNNILKENNIKYLFPVQTGFIPWQLKASKHASLIYSQDACISAPTGSGKTLAFVIPVLQYLLEKSEQRNLTVKAVRVLIVLPTQSLALQIYNVFKSFANGTGITVGIMTSCNTTFKNEQILLVTNNSVWGSCSRTDIVVCTAGRLTDHIQNTKGFDLQHLEYIVIDEADQDLKQDDWLHHLEKHLQSYDIELSNKNIVNISSMQKRLYPQKLLFSATLSSDPEKIKKWSLFQPKLFTCVARNEEIGILNNNNDCIGTYTLPENLTEKYVLCTADNKPIVLYNILTKQLQSASASPRVLVFVHDVDTGHRLSVLMCMMLRKSLIVKEISDRTNKDHRKKIISSLLSGEVNVLICTNFMARGTDIPSIDCVISYNSPVNLITYIHRAGRTARAGTHGLCITMVEQHEKKRFLRMLNKDTYPIQQLHIPDQTLHSLDALYKKSLDQFKLKIQREKQLGLSKLKQMKRVFKRTTT